MKTYGVGIVLVVAMIGLFAGGCTSPPMQSTLPIELKSSSSESQMEQSEISDDVVPIYADWISIWEKYDINTDGFDIFTIGVEDRPLNYRVGGPVGAYFHTMEDDEADFLDMPRTITMIVYFSLFPVGSTGHPMFVPIAYPKEIVDQTGMLKFEETIYSWEEMQPLLVYSDDVYYVYQVQSLVCGQSFNDCWLQLIQYAQEDRENANCRWPDEPIDMEYNDLILDAYTYLQENISELIVPISENPK